MLGAAILKGMTVTAKNFVGSYYDKERLTTIQYPEEQRPPEENYRNFPFLVFDKDPDAGLRCVACKICETECPPQCIYIEVLRDANGKVQKKPKVFDIDYSVCMGCQICVEACPFDAIKMDNDFELSTDNRFGGLLMNKDYLAKSNEYYHRIKPEEAAAVDAKLEADAAKKKKPAAKPAAPKPAASTAPAKPMATPTKIVIPEDAPFNPEQREWLQKLFAQVSFGGGGAPAASAPSAAAASAGGDPVEAAPEDEAENPDLTNDVPWHDPDKDMGTRMGMVQGKPLEVKLYAAMGQTDCTACGYDCKGYAMALAAGAEKDPGLCVPGGDETAAKVKELLSAAGKA
jgi:NADH-quinone oxidoreductase subunit I